MAAAVRNSAVFGGMNALGAALYGLVISKDAALQCEAAVQAHNVLLIVHGTAGNVLKAAGILEQGRSGNGAGPRPAIQSTT